jgi:hypothetical protein
MSLTLSFNASPMRILPAELIVKFIDDLPMGVDSIIF